MIYHSIIVIKIYVSPNKLLYELISKRYQSQANATNEEKLIKLLGGNNRIIDLLFHRPRYFINRYNFKNFYLAKPNEVITVIAIVKDYNCIKKKRLSIINVICAQKNSNSNNGYNKDFIITFFNQELRIIKQRLKKDQHYAVSGIMEGNKMPHPDKIIPMSEFSRLLPLEPKYSLTSGINNDYLCNLLQKILEDFKNQSSQSSQSELKELEWIAATAIEKMKWPSWLVAMKNYHFPSSLSFQEKCRQRLAYDEALALYLHLDNLQGELGLRKKEPLEGNGLLRKILIERLGFELTNDQQKVAQEIFVSQALRKTMLMLLQGDVGSGKTVVAFLAMLNAAECGKQAALLVPTGILVNQHYENLRSLLPEVEIEKLLSSTTLKKKKEILEGITAGDVKIIVGTHALFNNNINWNNLALVVIDEQHRFGADQRTKLLMNNTMADLLMITATPIPKTYSQILFSFIQYLSIKNKPKNRKEVKTVVIKASKIKELIKKFELIIGQGSKIFWVCPALEENENLPMTSALQRCRELKEYFASQPSSARNIENMIDCVHGGLTQKNIDKIIESFRNNEEGAVKILVATTVIEVGIDIPDADIMIIENAERFGLAQLHQLRGRVGRGDKESTCILIYNDEGELNERASERLKTLKDSQDGFYIAEQDFKIRGGGELFGLKQSGLFNFKFIDEQRDREIIELAAEQVKFIIENNQISSYKFLINMFFSVNNYYL